VFQAVAVIGAHAHVGVDIEPGDVRAPLAHDCRLGIFTAASQPQHPTSSAWTGGDQSLHGGIRQIIERCLPVVVRAFEVPQVARDLAADRAGDARDIFIAGGRQRMEQHGSVRLLRVHAVHRDGMEVNVQVQRRAKALHHGQAAELQPAAQLVPAGSLQRARKKP